MWNSQKSLILSLICTKIAMAMTLIAAVLLPVYLKYSLLMSYGPYRHISDIIPFMIMIYICTVLGLTALIFLHRLLSNISEDLIFNDDNVRYIRTISWCCFGVAALAAGCTYYYHILALVAVFGAFTGLILRVVKNVFSEAVRIKSENDFTI